MVPLFLCVLTLDLQVYARMEAAQESYLPHAANYVTAFSAKALNQCSRSIAEFTLSCMSSGCELQSIYEQRRKNCAFLYNEFSQVCSAVGYKDTSGSSKV